MVIVIGGKSLSGQIAMHSHDLISVATYDQYTNRITVEVSDFFFPDDDTSFFMDIDKGAEWKKTVTAASRSGFYPRFLGYLVLSGLFLAGLFGIYLYFVSLLFLSFIILPIWQLSYQMRHYDLAGWHGAEHKAIAAYNKSGATDLDSIRAAPRVNFYCGTRMMVFMMAPPFFSLLTALQVLASTFSFEMTFQELIFSLFAALWVAIVVFFLMAIFIEFSPLIWISYLLQYFLTTKEPSEIELRTAQAALLALVEAEELSSHESPPTSNGA